jgi:Flp pilus assembly protein TadB
MQTDRSIPELTKEMAFHLGDMFRNEVKLAKVEAAEGVKSLSGAFRLYIAAAAIGACALTLGLLSVAYLISLVMPLWTAMAIVAIGAGILCWILVEAAQKAAKPDELSLPKTREQVSRDLKTLSERVH